MITRLNLERIENEQFGYIMGVKHRQDEMMSMLLEDDSLFKDRITEWLGWRASKILPD